MNVPTNGSSGRLLVRRGRVQERCPACALERAAGDRFGELALEETVWHRQKPWLPLDSAVQSRQAARSERDGRSRRQWPGRGQRRTATRVRQKGGERPLTSVHIEDDSYADPTASSEDPRLAEIVRRLVAALHPQRIYLFGSRARGDHRADSDYDVLVVVQNLADRPYALERQAYWALRSADVPVDVIVMTADRFDRRQVVKASLPATIGRDGRLLYAA